MSNDIRDIFFDGLFDLAKNDPNIIFLAADQGAFSLNNFRNELPTQYYNIGISEQALISISSGLALSNKRVFAYAIAPFITSRCFEQIKIDMCVMNLPITLIGSGPGLCYSADGPTHHSCEDIGIMSSLPNMNIYTLSDQSSSEYTLNDIYIKNSPSYVRLDKGQFEELNFNSNNLSDGFNFVKKGKDLVIIAQGYYVKRAQSIATELETEGHSVAVIDLVRINPETLNKLVNYISNYNLIFTIEDTFINSGIGSIILNYLYNNYIFEKKLFKIGPERFVQKYGNREWIENQVGLDKQNIKNSIKQKLKEFT